MASLPRIAALSLSVLALLAGCGAPPQGVGEVEEILAGAADPAADFAVVPVTRQTLPMIAAWPGQPSRVATSGWLPRGSAGAKEPVIAVGDRLDVAIWSNEENGLLTVGGQKSTPLPNLRVSTDGTLFLPYAGSVQVAGLTVDAARQTIQDQLVTIMPSAQVLVNHETGQENSVQVVSGLPQSGVVGMPDRNFTVLDLIATAGGVPPAMVNPQVRVQRGSKLYGIAFDDLLQNPTLDAVLLPGDRIFVQPEQRYFLSFGALAKEAQIRFPTAKVSALDAVSLIGGLDEYRANPKGVLVLRDYPASAVRNDGSGPNRQRMVFVFDLVSADGLFSAGDFQIQDKDLVLVAQSPLLNDTAIMAFISDVLGLPVSGANAVLALQKF